MFRFLEKTMRAGRSSSKKFDADKTAEDNP